MILGIRNIGYKFFRHVSLKSRHPSSKILSLARSNINCTSNRISSLQTYRYRHHMSDQDILYPHIEAFHQGQLQVSPIHTIYYEQSGNKNGIPVVFLHGGPGGGVGPRDRRYFDPEIYHIVLFDQRGSGKSTPAFSLEDNNTWALVEDIEKLRAHLNISKWMVFGGSWGSTLALAYSQRHINRVSALILRGIFMLRDEEVRWFYQEGASFIFPDMWDDYISPIPENERHDMITAYYKRLTGNDKEEQLRCAKAWSTWEMATCRLFVDHESIDSAEDDKFALAFARIECHYFTNKGFFRPNQLLQDAHIIRDSNIPVTIVQGRYDVVCPAKSAWDLYKELPNADFHLVEDAGHSSLEEGIAYLLVEASEKYKTILKT